MPLKIGYTGVTGPLENNPPPGLSDHVHDFRNIMRSTQPKQFRFLRRSWYNTADIDPGAQNPNLRFQKLKLGICAEA